MHLHAYSMHSPTIHSLSSQGQLCSVFIDVVPAGLGSVCSRVLYLHQRKVPMLAGGAAIHAGCADGPRLFWSAAPTGEQ